MSTRLKVQWGLVILEIVLVLMNLSFFFSSNGGLPNIIAALFCAVVGFMFWREIAVIKEEEAFNARFDQGYEE